MLRSIGSSPGLSPEEEKGRLPWEGSVEKEGISLE